MPNQDCRNYIVRNISGTFQETIVQGMCQKKSQQRTRGQFCAKILPLRVLLPSPPREIT